MAERSSSAQHLLGDDLYTRIGNCKLLVVGAGGIGCELLKNIALAGFRHVHVVDLDTIELTNLNRQFLFQQQHVGQSKAKVASERVKRFNPSINITAYHASIFESRFDLKFFENFDMVMNALDNLKARNHVNRMCLSANKPLIESGSAGYLGQVSVIMKGKTECYECTPKPPPKHYPACTIRNTPSTIVHCVVWAKFLFNHLYGEADQENDITPNLDDPNNIESTSEKPNDNRISQQESQSKSEEKINTRRWAVLNNHDPRLLLEKLFHHDIQVLLDMTALWKSRAKPQPLDLGQISSVLHLDQHEADVLPEQKLWSIRDCIDKFLSSASVLRNRFNSCEGKDHLVWDKDDDVSMDFVCASANLRANVFGIPLKSRFDIKSIAGNIIPAIATTNAVVAGLIVNEAFKILRGDFDLCRAVYLSRTPMGGNKLLAPLPLAPPNPSCYICSQQRPTITIKLNLATVTVELLAETILKKNLSFIAPEIVLASGQELLGIPEDDDEREEMVKKIYPRTLSSFNITDGTKCTVSDDLQGELILTLVFRQLSSADPDAPLYSIHQAGTTPFQSLDKRKLDEQATMVATAAIQSEVISGDDIHISSKKCKYEKP
eukprot:gene6382-9303_t